MHLIRWALALSLLWATCAMAADKRLTTLDDYINDGLADWQLPGIAVAVVEKDQLRFARGFGIKQVGKPDPIDEHTLFQIGSTSKAIAAAAIGVLVDKGDVAWDQPLIDYLPWLKLSDPWVAGKVTLRDMLLHRSGIQDAFYPILTPLSARQVAEKIPELGNALPFRQQYAYSNLGYGITGLTVEAVSGMTWARFVETQLFEPMGMKDSGGSPYNYWAEDQVAPVFLGTAPAGRINHDQSRHPNVAMPHGLDRAFERRVLPWMSYDNMAAAGSVVSSVADMSRWLRMLLNEGSLDGRQILQASTVEELLRPQILISGPGHNPFADEGGYNSYALGWSRGEMHGYQFVSHGGGIFGFPAFMAILPELDIGIVVLANGSTYTPYYPHKEIAARVVDLLLKLPSRNLRDTYLEQHQALATRVESFYQQLNGARKSDEKPNWSPAELVGRYVDKLAGKLDIRYQNGTLRAAIEGAGAFSGTLEHWHGNTFRLWYDGGDGGAFAGTEVTFVADDTGNISHLDGKFLGQYYHVSE